MEKSALPNITIVAVFALLILSIVFLLVPGTAAGDDISYVGIVNFTTPNTCWMIDPLDGSNTSYPVAEDIFFAPPGSKLPPETPVDVVAFFRCQTTFSDYTGPAVKVSGSNTFNCWAYFEDNPLYSAQTSSWTQTVSSSGNATLTCHFRGNTSKN